MISKRRSGKARKAKRLPENSKESRSCSETRKLIRCFKMLEIKTPTLSVLEKLSESFLSTKRLTKLTLVQVRKELGMKIPTWTSILHQEILLPY